MDTVGTRRVECSHFPPWTFRGTVVDRGDVLLVGIVHTIMTSWGRGDDIAASAADSDAMKSEGGQSSRVVASCRDGVIDALIAALIAAGALGALLVTSRDYGMVWDEGFTVRREEALWPWFTFLANPPERH